MEELKNKCTFHVTIVKDYTKTWLIIHILFIYRLLFGEHFL
jgi:hypothetical protein